MLFTYVRRELKGRRRQTVIVATGLALAVALVIAVSAASAGVRSAQADVLDSVYGVGTDITVSQAAEPGQGGGQRFQFGTDDGTTDGDGTRVAQDNLNVDRGTTATSEDTVGTVADLDGVSEVTATLKLRSTTFNGELPDPSTAPDPSSGAAPGRGPGGGGFAGGDFDVTSYTVEGIQPGASALGPLSGAAVADGRGFTADDAGQAVALVSQSYADSEGLAVGGSLTIKGTAVVIVGILGTDSSATTLSDVYLPLDVAQTLSGLTGQVTNLYVQAASADTVATVADAIGTALPDTTVTTQEDLAAGVTGSLASASSLVQRLGTWLSIAVLVAAFALAVLFTISGVTRRTRDFGTLKAIGWGNGRIVRQVGAESLVQGALGGLAGLVVGLAGIAAINAAGITLTGVTAAATPAAPAGPGAFGGERGDPFATAGSTLDVVLHAPIDVTVVLLGIGLALAGGLLAGVVGGWRASRLRPAAALRSLD